MRWKHSNVASAPIDQTSSPQRRAPNQWAKTSEPNLVHGEGKSKSCVISNDRRTEHGKPETRSPTAGFQGRK